LTIVATLDDMQRDSWNGNSRGARHASIMLHSNHFT